ncbi:DNA topoisomerase IV subunit A [Propylenella binzhouense]|uniref:DNA topoisomerase 4 subunit A n=1 Tax=Propylenella binzhouense TaxID=2555902 RepID=A0A964T1T9_9HYPH|nr:DNA topoisomerase IV subunit A [Propylenella binzhouense]MYZ46689.1 DNA topoisomerase IV subunit A [Propylenella binzhouense]
MGQKPNLPGDGPGPDGTILPVNLREALEERYLAYALSTIMNRALPDVRDGLKPVHRRIVYAMREMRLNPDGGYKKCAKVVGEVMGNFHPHGDQAIYDALVRLAQDFAVRYPLVDGQGNFGNIDGDNAAAMRYTEARMTVVADLLLEGIDEDAVDFRATYDGEGREPVVLPGAFPNLLANGSAGIAVGMATNIPPHNVAELCTAALHLIKHPNASDATLCELVPGPDFPTGGIIVSARSEIAEAYRTGRGSFRIRARWTKEEGSRGAYEVVVTEIPYQVPKSRLIEQIANLIEARKLPLVGNIRDESAQDVRIVIEPKSRAVDPGLMMESLFRLTDLEARFSMNVNVLSHGQVPKVMPLGQVLREWLAHRKVVLVRRSHFRLGKIAHRLEVLGGYLVAYLNLDEVIRIIREEDDPKAFMIAKFGLTDVQVEAILNMRLRALRKLEEIEIRTEHDRLVEEQADLRDLVGSDERQWKCVGYEISEVRKAFGPETPLGRRRTGFADAPAIDLDDIQQAMIEREPITIVLSERGWIRALKGHIQDLAGLTFKEGDHLKRAFHAQTTDKILLFTTGGRFFTLDPSKFPGGRSQGEPVRLMVDMEKDQDVVTAFVHDPERQLLVVSAAGYGFLVPEKEVVANTRKGKQVLNVTAPDEAKLCVAAEGDHVATIGTNRKMLVFPRSQVMEMTRGKGVRLQRFKDGEIADVRTFAGAQGLSWVDSAGRVHTRSLAELLDWTGDRAQAGRIAPQGFPKSNRFGTPGL